MISDKVYKQFPTTELEQRTQEGWAAVLIGKETVSMSRPLTEYELIEQRAQDEIELELDKLQIDKSNAEQVFIDTKYLQEKFVDGRLTAEEYAPIREKRAQAAADIQRLRDKINRLRG